MWSTQDHEKNELCAAIRAIDGARVLEIGAFEGVTTREIAAAVAERNGRVVVIDPMRWAAEVVANGITRHLPAALAKVGGVITSVLGAATYEPAFWRNVADLRPFVTLHRALSTSPAVLESTSPELAAFDVVFIDGDHSHAGASDDLRNWGRRVAPGGTIFVHDAVARFPGVMRALREFEQREGLEVRYPVRGSLASIRVPEGHRFDMRVATVGERAAMHGELEQAS